MSRPRNDLRAVAVTLILTSLLGLAMLEAWDKEAGLDFEPPPSAKVVRL